MKHFAILGAALFPFISAAAVVGVVPGGAGARLELMDEPGLCVGRALSSAWISADGTRIPGCWIKNASDNVQSIFFDGGIVQFPAQLIQPAAPL
jgi:hypothetical protein